MRAQASRDRLELHLDSKARRLFIYQCGEHISASLCGPGKNADRLMFTMAAPSECRLEPGSFGPCIWVGHALIELSPDEADQIAAMFVPLGLRDQRAHQPPEAPR